MDKRAFFSAAAKYVVNPLARLVAGRTSAVALLETTGRTSGEPRRTPVSDGLDGDTFWIVAEHGRNADYVRNIEESPHVRVLTRGRWRRGLAHILPDDDARARLASLHPIPRLGVRIAGTDLLTIRVTLDPVEETR